MLSRHQREECDMHQIEFEAAVRLDQVILAVIDYSRTVPPRAAERTKPDETTEDFDIPRLQPERSSNAMQSIQPVVVSVRVFIIIQHLFRYH